MTNFVPTQAMINNGGVVIRLSWRMYSGTAGNVVMTEWVPLVSAPNAALVLTPASISENGGVSTVTATLSSVSSAAVTITVSAAAGAGAGAADFSLSSATTLTIAAGSTMSAGSVTITANDNSVASGSKQVTVSATAAGGNGVAAPSSATLTITDDDAPQTTLLLSSSSIAENAGVATVTATLDRTSGAATTITVSAAAGAGAGAADFSLSSATTLTIAANATTSTGTVTITANNNDVDAADKTVTVSGMAANSQGAGSVTGATLTLTDDDAAPGVTLLLSSSSIAENGGVATVTATLSHPSVAATTITVSAAAGAGAVAADFSLSSATTLTIAANATTSTGTVTIAAVDNDVAAADKTVTVSGMAANSQGAGSVTGATLTLTDDEAAPGVTLTVSPASISENGGVATVTATLSHPSSAATTITVSAAPGTNAVAGDYTLSAATTLTIAANATTSSGTVTIEAVDNDVAAADKTVTVSGMAANSQGAGSVTGATLTLTDDEAAPGVTLTVSPASISENGGVATVTATLSHPSVAATTITVSAAAGAGAVAADFSLSSATTLTIAANATTSTGTVTIAAVDNDVAAADKTVTVSGMAANSQGAGSVTGATLTLTDDEAALRARLKAINESVLPELSRALWGSALDAVTGRLESPDAAAPTAADGLEAAATFARANESALEEGDVSWKELLGESFAFGLAGDGEDGPGAGGVVAWGSGDWRRLSRDEDALDWSGDAFSAHVGVDAALRSDLRAGLAASRFWSDVDYTDRNGDAAVKGSHESRMTSLTPYLGWAAGGGTRLWGAAGYGWGEIEIVDEDLRARFRGQTADSRFLAGAVGGSAPVWSRGLATLKAKGSAEATRWRVKDNAAAIAGVKVLTQRLRLAAEGSWVYALTGGASLTPTLETGVRWDGGDGATGTGLEAGGGLSWTDPTRGLTVEAKGHALVAHNKDVEEWGASGSMRLDPDADGFGLSFRLLPSWGASESGVARLWDEGAAARPTDGGGGNEARLETELGYGLPAFGGAGVTTPYAGFGLAQGGERDMRAGVRLGLGTGFDLGIEAERRENAAAPEHAVRLGLRIRW